MKQFIVLFFCLLLSWGISAQSISVGTTEGVFNVSDMGAATYSIPLKLPAGIAGVMPSISLNYNSQGGNGIMGMGWSLSATSAITRSGKNIYLDKKVDGISGTANDRFALDGNRLILRSGTYGAASSVYATEIESFRKIVANGALNTAGSYFTVTDQNGWTYTYGELSQATVKIPGTSVPLMWLLYRVEDLNGNIMQYEYDIDAGEEPRISHISYTATPGTIAHTVVSFYYETRPDPNFSYVAGGKLQQNYRLSGIYVRGRDAGGSLVNIRSYTMSYATDIYTHLIKVTEKGNEAAGTPESLPPTEFDYAASGTQNISEVVASAPDTWMHLVGDYNGDGFSDYIKVANGLGGFVSTTSWSLYLNNGSGGYTLSTSGTLPASSGGSPCPGCTPLYFHGSANLYMSSNSNIFDYNGDGKDEFVTFKYTSSGANTYLYVYIYDFSDPGYLAYGFPYQTMTPLLNVKPYAGDFDGDGKFELILIPTSTTASQPVIIGKDYGAPVAYPGLSLQTLSGLTFTEEGDTKANVVDYNGDGKDDLMMTWDIYGDTYTLNVAFDTSNKPIVSSPSFTFINRATGYPTDQHRIFTGDFNADGITDILTWESSDHWKIGYGKGNGLFDKVTFAGSLFNTDPYGSYGEPYPIQYEALYVADFNGDGKSDIYQGFNASSGGFINYSKGNSQFVSETVTFTAATNPRYRWNYTPADVNADGMIDFLLHNTNKPVEALYFKNGENRHAISKVTNGLTATTGITYDILTNAAIYASGTTSYSFPFVKKAIPFKVVSKITLDNMSSSGSDITYSYKGLKYHTWGKGLLGFDNIISKDVLRDRTEEKTYRVNTTYAFPYLQRILTKQGTATMSIASNSYNVYDYGNKCIFPYISKSSFTDEITLQNRMQMFDYSTAAGQIDPFTIGKPRVVTTFNGYNPLIIIDMDGTPLPVEKTVETSTFVASGSTAAAYIKSKPVSVLTETTRDGQPVYSRKVNFTYNTANGQVATIITDPATANAVTTTYTYNTFGNLIKAVTSATGLTTRTENIEYDPTNRFVKARYNSAFPNVKTVNTYDMLTGWLTQSVEADGLVTNYTYDGFGRTKTVSNSNGKSVTTNYLWSEGHPYTTTIAASKYVVETVPNTEAASYVFYDRLDRVTRWANKGFNGQMIFVDDRYDGKGRLARHSNPYFEGTSLANTTYGYDDYDRMTGENPPGDNDIDYVYTTLDNTYEVTTTNAAGQSKKVTTDRSGKMVTAEDEGGSLSYLYHSNGNIKEVKLGSTVVQATEYDAYGRKTKETDPNYGSYEYTYNAFDEVKTLKDPKAQVYSYAYNQLGDITTKTGPEGTYTYTYGTAAGTNCGKLTKIVGPEGTEESNYGTGSKISWHKTIIGTEVLTTEYTYDAYGRMKTMKYPSSVIVQYNYNANDGSNSSINKVNSSGTILEYLYVCDNKNAFGQITAFGQAIRRIGANTYYKPYTTQSYTTYGLLTEQRSYNETETGSMPLRLFQYDFSAITGNLNWRKDVHNNREEDFAYDDLNRLTSSQSQVISPPSMLTANSLSYYNNGNISSKTDAGVFTYDPENKVKEIEPFYNIPTTTQTATYKPFNKVADITEGTWQATFTYGPSGERNKMELREGGVLKKTKYYGVDYEKEVDAATGAARQLSYVAGPDGNYVAILEGTTKTYYTLSDHLGSITHIIDNGTITEERSFDPWGRYRNPTTWAPIAPTAVSYNFDRGYTGHEYLPKFGIINMNGRLYDPVMGRMFSADPYIMGADNSQGYNRYSYVLNNPLKYTDPTGNYALIDDLIAMAIGGVFNLASNAISGNIGSIGQGLSYFAVGALAGEASLYGGPMAGGAVLGLGNDLTKQVSANGWQGVNWEQAALSTGVGAATSWVGARFGNNINPFVSKLTSGIASPVVQNATSQAIGGAIVGTGMGAGVSWAQGNDLNTIIKDGFSGGVFGMTNGLISGSVQGVKTARKMDRNPWTGKPNTVIDPLPTSGLQSIELNYNKSTAEYALKYNKPVEAYIQDISRAEVFSNLIQQAKASGNATLNTVTNKSGQTLYRLTFNGTTYQYRSYSSTGPKTLDIFVGKKYFWKLRLRD